MTMTQGDIVPFNKRKMKRRKKSRKMKRGKK